MSTRCMVLVAETYDGSGKFIPLYRHSDGYLLGAGSTIAEVLSKSPVDAESLLSLLFAERYDHDGTDGGPIHRAATWQPEEQGDLEYVYVIQPASRGGSIGPRSSVTKWTVTVYGRSNWTRDDWREWGHDTYSLAQLLAKLEKEQAAYDWRLARRVQQAKRDSPRPCSICRRTHGSEIVHECE